MTRRAQDGWYGLSKGEQWIKGAPPLSEQWFPLSTSSATSSRIDWHGSEWSWHRDVLTAQAEAGLSKRRRTSRWYSRGRLPPTLCRACDVVTRLSLLGAFGFVSGRRMGAGVRRRRFTRTRLDMTSRVASRVSADPPADLVKATPPTELPEPEFARPGWPQQHAQPRRARSRAVDVIRLSDRGRIHLHTSQGT